MHACMHVFIYVNFSDLFLYFSGKKMKSEYERIFILVLRLCRSEEKDIW